MVPTVDFLKLSFLSSSETEWEMVTGINRHERDLYGRIHEEKESCYR